MNDLIKAERDVEQSQKEFQRSIDHLQEAFGDVGQRISQSIEDTRERVIERPRRAVVRFTNQTLKAADFGYRLALEIFQRAKQAARPGLKSLQEDPRTLIGIGAVCLGTTLLILGKNKNTAIEIEQDFDFELLDEEPDYLEKKVS